MEVYKVGFALILISVLAGSLFIQFDLLEPKSVNVIFLLPALIILLTEIILKKDRN